MELDSLNIRALENVIRTNEEILVKNGDVLRVDGKLVSQRLAELEQELKELKEAKANENRNSYRGSGGKECPKVP
jgi:hypothetical protein